MDAKDPSAAIARATAELEAAEAKLEEARKYGRVAVRALEQLQRV
jgi:hypothetical protein